MKAFNYPLIREHRLIEMPVDIWMNFFIYLQKREVFCVGVTLFYVCILLKNSSSVEFVKSLFKNIFRKLILRIEEISTAVFFKQNLLVQKTVLVKLTQNVLWSFHWFHIWRYSKSWFKKYLYTGRCNKRIRSTQKLFSSCLCLLVSQTGLVSKPKSEGFGLAGQFPFTKRGMKLNFLSWSSFKKK